MTDKMKRLEKEAVTKLAFLSDAHGFSRLLTKRDKWTTTISALSTDIAVEIELDWRELDVFVLITALADGELPGGYYVSSGKKCRIHLENVLKDRCGVSDADLRNSVKPQVARSERDECTMERRLDEYLRLAKQHISEIRERGVRLFEGGAGVSP